MPDATLLKVAILETLKQFDDPMNEKAIVLSLSVTYCLKPTYTEVRECLAGLEEARYVATVKSELRGVLWALTNKGKAELLAN